MSERLSTFLLASRVRRMSHFTVGLVCIVIVAVIWVVASKLVQYISSATNVTFFLTYTCNSLFAFYLPLVGIAEAVRTSMGGVRRQKQNQTTYDTANLSQGVRSTCV